MNDTYNYFKEEFEKKQTLDEQKQFCYDVTHYNNEDHPEWQEKLEKVEDKYQMMIEILETQPSPLKEFLRIWMYSFKPEAGVSKSYLLSDDELYNRLLECKELSKQDKYIIKASKVEGHFSDAEYEKAEKVARELFEKEDLPIEVVVNMMKYLTNTRRYNDALALYETYDHHDALKNMYADSVQRLTGQKKEYRPGTKDKIDLFSKFMNECLNVNVKPSGKSHSDRMADKDYPKFEFTSKMDFDSFVAYDVETSGLDPKYDYVTEIGAIRVVNGKITDSKEFKFQELVHPYGKPKKLPADIIDLTGITQKMVDEARNVKEVFNDFADFIGDDILVGYNSYRFDAKFLRRAGRYAFRVINNKQFDVLPVTYVACDTDDNTLNTVAASLGIENPQAHRAYADALTTAKVYLKIKELEDKGRAL